jgi:hypothetical protein
MLKFLLPVLGIFVGFVVFVVGFSLTEVIGYFAHPFPAGFDHNSVEQVFAHVKTYPAWMFGVATATWGMTVFLAAWVATKVCPTLFGLKRRNYRAFPCCY